MLCACVLVLLFCAVALPSRADTVGPDISAMQLSRTDEGLFLSASMQFDLPSQVEDALRQGIPMYFTAEVQVQRERWYWSDQQLGTATRYYRLTHQPLTKRWRLHISNTAFASSGTGLALGQSYDQLDEALGAIQRISRWKILEPTQLSATSGVSVQLRFRVDLSALPRPLQIGALGRSGWNLQLARTQVLEAAP
ncbi:DUF4390 domain-containing protein [Comamonas fluminis]|uniref:DUF4390 domain-containing protein n=1 Tax=Comamonas fluminis TaxID=2796366 RepID=UPI001C454825|nr:DUF4390 domain-containing protein [Comamonas fluminis]